MGDGLLDIITLVKDYLYAQWTETDPPKTGTGAVIYALGHSEFDKLKAYPQIKIQELPGRVTHTYITADTYRVEHEVLLTVYIRPVNYTDTVLDAAEVTFRKCKTEVDNILKAGRHSLTGVISVDLTGWEEVTVEENEPIVFVATQVIRCVYYE